MAIQLPREQPTTSLGVQAARGSWKLLRTPWRRARSERRRRQFELTYKLVLAEVNTAITRALDRLDLKPVHHTISSPPSPELGDLSSNAAFAVSMLLGATPQEAASRIASSVDLSSLKFVKEVKHHHGGYVNFVLNAPALAAVTARAILEEASYGLPKPGVSQRVSVEHTSVNPAHPLYVGHLRNVVVGDSLVRLLRSAGNEVYALNYIDDTGLQVATAVLGVQELGFSPEPPDGVKPDHYFGDLYVETNRRVESDPALEQKRKKVSEQLERGEGESAVIAHRLVDSVLKAQLETCWRVGAEYDLLNYESQILRLGLWSHVFEELKKKGVAKLARGGKFDGCWVMEGGTEDEEEKVLVRSDVTAVYAAKDIPYAAWKLGMLPDPFRYMEFAPQKGRILWATTAGEGLPPPAPFNKVERTISVIGVEQVRPQKFVKAALMALGAKGSGYHHLAYGKVSLSAKTAEQIEADTTGSGPVKMKGRTGVYVAADEALDSLRRKALAETKKRNPNAGQDWLELTAEKIAVGAIRYELVKQDLNKPIVFDMDEALRLEGDTGPYLMYSFARARSVLRRSGKDPASLVYTPSESMDPAEKALVISLSRMETELEDALAYLNPRVVARYSYSLAMAFNLFYEKCVILSVEPQLRDWRLVLTHCFTQVLARSLDVIGVPHPEAL